MATVVLGLISATGWGTADFGGGLLSRRAPLFGVVLISIAVPCVLVAIASRVVAEPLPTGEDLIWATLAGIAAGIGILSLYHGLAVGRMSVVAPVTGVLAATIPVVVGIVLEGAPSTPILLGILAAILAVVLVSRVSDERSGGSSGLLFGLVAGLGLGTFNVLADRLSPGAFLGQLALFKGVEALLVAAMILIARRPVAVPRRLLPAVVAVGLLDLVGNGGYILATQTGELAVAAVLSSLYPAVTIILATLILKERVTRSHAAGMALAALAIVLIAAGDAIWAAIGGPGRLGL